MFSAYCSLQNTRFTLFTILALYLSLFANAQASASKPQIAAGANYTCAIKRSRQPLRQTTSKTSTLIIFFFYHGILSYRIKPCIGFRIYTTACFFCRRAASSLVYKQIKQAIVFKYEQSYTEMNQ